MRYQTGVTLGEMLVVLTVVAVMTTVGMPALGGFIAAQRIATASNLIVADLHFARTRAVGDFQRVSLCPSADGQTCTGGNRWEDGWIVFAAYGGDGQPESPGDILRVVQPRTSTHITSTRPHTRFLPDGQARSRNLTFTVCGPARPERARAIIVSQTGRVRSEARPAEDC